MLIRTLCGFALLPILIVVIFFAPSWVLPIALAVICAMAQHELLLSTGLVRSRLVAGAAMLFAAAVPIWFYFGCPASFGFGGGAALVGLLFLWAMNSQGELRFAAVAETLFSSLLVPMFLSTIILIALSDNGRALIILPFIAAWMSDTGAYFIGSFFGRHKLCPTISPKKTVEGSLGGVFAAVLTGVIFGLIMRFGVDTPVRFWVIIVVCAVGAVAGQIGDLIFSFIKREVQIKDYAHLVPGQGGVMDRFDSLFLAAPTVYALMLALPNIII